MMRRRGWRPTAPGKLWYLAAGEHSPGGKEWRSALPRTVPAEVRRPLRWHRLDEWTAHPGVSLWCRMMVLRPAAGVLPGQPIGGGFAERRCARRYSGASRFKVGGRAGAPKLLESGPGRLCAAPSSATSGDPGRCRRRGSAERNRRSTVCIAYRAGPARCPADPAAAAFQLAGNIVMPVGSQPVARAGLPRQDYPLRFEGFQPRGHRRAVALPPGTPMEPSLDERPRARLISTPVVGPSMTRIPATRRRPTDPDEPPPAFPSLAYALKPPR